jgi:hypothetical protein
MWQTVSEDSRTAGSNFLISNENGQLSARISRGDIETLWVKLRKTESCLLLRSKFADPGGDCWYVVEDVITFNDRMEDMPVRSKIVEGSRCVSVGRVSEAILSRVE